ncbi:hypothetical protein ACFY0R_25800 [Streptomyces sp. NPDC001633]|uniref:hypothetical protein n=1 Tax=Streptomyces sp. NPDC001633 TaxID=3364595 RepID=UPI0036A03ED9
MKLHVQGKPDLRDRRLLVEPRIVTLTYLLDAPDPVGGIYPSRAEVAGPLVTPLIEAFRHTAGNEVEEPLDNTHVTWGRNWRAVWLYPNYPENWPSWLIELGAKHRPTT